MKIGEKTIKRGCELINDLLITNIGQLNVAFRNSGEGEFKIPITLIVKPGSAEGNFKLTAKTKIPTDFLEDSFSASVDEKQMSLNLNEPTKVCPMRDDGAEIFVSVCAKCKDRESVILIDGKHLPVWKGHKGSIMEPKEGYEMVQFMPCSAWADEDYKAWCDSMERKADIMIAALEEKKAQEKPKFKR